MRWWLMWLGVAATAMACSQEQSFQAGGQSALDADVAHRDAGTDAGIDADRGQDAATDRPDAASEPDASSNDRDAEPDDSRDAESDQDRDDDLEDANVEMDADADGPPPTEVVRFVAFGDWGVGTISRIDEAADAMWSLCQLQGCDFALGLGDNFYDDGVTSVDDPQWESKFQQPFAAWDIPFYMSLGNHDYRGEPDAQVEYTELDDRWTMPARWFELDAAPVHVAALDTNTASLAQATGLSDGLRATEQPWRIAFGHHPMRSNGVHGDTGGSRRELIDWVLCGQADLYLAGHDHDLQHLLPACGVDLVVSGAVSRTRAVEVGDNTTFAASTRGFAWIEVTPARLTLEIWDLEGERLYTWEREAAERRLVCVDDDYCEPACGDDPDCAGVDCSHDDACDDRCPTDPDCFRDCPCDFNPGICEPIENPSLVPCGCDTACRGARQPCVADGHCDSWCPPDTDPDC